MWGVCLLIYVVCGEVFEEGGGVGDGDAAAEKYMTFSLAFRGDTKTFVSQRIPIIR